MQKAKLNRHREHLLQLRDRLREDINGLAERLPETVTSPGEVSTLGTHNADHDSEGLDAELAIEHNQESIYHEVEKALQRIEKNSYGVCQECGGVIAEERLHALPYTPYCSACARELHASRQPPA